MNKVIQLCILRLTSSEVTLVIAALMASKLDGAKALAAKIFEMSTKEKKA